MKKIIVLVALVFSYAMGTSQAITQRGTTAVTVQDARLFAQYNFKPPTFTDTVQANLQIGLDSCGALIYSRDINSYYYRACSPKRWVRLSPTITPTGDSAWQIFGNTGTIAGTNFLGTKDNVPLEFRVNNVKSGYIDSTNRNTALGFGSQRSTLSTVGIDTAQYNTSVGYRALGANLYGDQNTAVGYAASALGTTGKGNTSVGYGASAQNRTSNYDAALGWGAMPRDYYGAYNVAIGANVNNMLPPSIGDTMRYNTFIGASSAAYQRAGRNNVFVGDSTGANNQTGSRNVLIGSKAGLNETGSDRLYISNSKTPNPLIKGNFGDSTLNVNGKMSISLTSQTPDSSLDVTGGVKLRTINRANFPTDSMLVLKADGGVGKREVIIPSNTSVTRIISGSAVWDSLLVYSVTKCFYYINGILYNSAATNVTLAPADSSNPRIDVIYCDTLGNVGVITGIPSPNPVKPTVNPLSQIELTHIDVNAQATTPAGISKKIIYNENTGLPGEWTTSSTSGAITFNYPTNPYKDLVSAFFDGASALNQSAIFTNNANVNADTLSLLSMYLRVNSTVASSGRTLLAIQLYKSGALISTPIQVSTGLYGYNENILSAYQQLAIPLSDFTFKNPLDKTFDQIKITAYDFAKLGFQIDYITAQVGGNPPPVTSNYWSLSGNDISSSPTSVLGTTSKNALSIVTVGQEAINIATDGLIKLPKVLSNTDTTNYKPLAINTTDGAVVRMDSWIGGGTGSVTAVTGVAPVFSSGGTTPSISMSIASTNTDGYLTQGDWNIFNNKLNPADTISLSTRVNNAYNSVTRLSDTSFYLKKPNDVKDTILLGNSIVYAENPIMARVSNDSNIIYFNADTAAAWRGGSGTIPTLQQVLDNNHDLVNNNNFQGTLAGSAQTGTHVNAFGLYAGEYNTGSWVNAFGFDAAETNVGNQVNAFGIAAGHDNSGSDVNFLGNLAGNANSGGSVNGLGLYAAKDNTGNNVNAFGYNTGVGNTANDINLFGKNASATANNQIVYTTDDGTYQTRLQQNNTQDNLINIPNESGTLLLDAPADGNLYGRQDNAWAIVSGGGGGGTVTSISQGYGITNSPNPIIATGTITADTSVGGLSGKYLRIVDGWKITGNAGTTTSNFLGTTDNVDLILKRNSTKVASFYSLNNISLSSDNYTGTGSSNVGIGTYGTGGLSTITTGSNNLFLGGTAGYRTNIGSANIAIGYQSGTNFFLIGDREGNSNISIGALAGNSYTGLPTGSRNISIGYFSGRNFGSSASGNIALGDSTELPDGLNPLTTPSTGNNNIIIGHRASSADRLGSNQLSIGNLIYGVNLDGYYSTIATGNIGIGVKAPTNKLEVAGTTKVTDTLKLTGLQSKTDTSANKPLAIDASGNVVKMSNWVSSGGSGTVYVDSIYRTAGKDSFFYKKNGITYAIKDSVGTNPAPVGYYGAFQDTTIQVAAAINTPYAMKLGVTDLSNAVTIVSDGSNLTRITIANTGIYNIQFSAQFDRTNSGTDVIDIWLRKNGVNVAGSGGKLVLTGGVVASAIIATWNYVLDVTAGDYYQLMWSTPDTHARLLYETAQTSPFVHPLIPSLILTVTQQSGIMAGTGITAINSLTGAAQTMVTGTDSTDFKIVSTGTTHKFNLPTSSATKRGALSSTDWSTFNSKIGAADTSVFQRKNIAANSIQANNTSSAANVTTQPFYDNGEAAYTGTISWTGTTNPSSVINNMYQWSRIGNEVSLYIVLNYTNPSSAITSITLDLPTGLPTPYSWTGFTSALSILYTGNYTIFATTTINPAVANRFGELFLRRNAANNGYELVTSTMGVATARTFTFRINYRAQ